MTNKRQKKTTKKQKQTNKQTNKQTSNCSSEKCTEINELQTFRNVHASPLLLSLNISESTTLRQKVVDFPVSSQSPSLYE